jgi:peptide/nickel transport system ATP-binding protein
MSLHDDLLVVKDVRKEYPVKTGALARRRVVLHAIDDASLTIRDGEVVGLIGESGSGKSTLGRIIVGLESPTAGSVGFKGRIIRQAGERESPGSELGIQMIFQNAVASLNPRQTVLDILSEAAHVHGLAKGSDTEFVYPLMQRVGLDPSLATRRPHELSGGQCQRICIARALSLKPTLLVCDEPVSALDVSIQAQVLNLFADLQEEFQYSYLFISHDLPVVQRLSHRVCIMYLGRIVESGPTADVFSAPAHPYTQALLSAVPSLDPGAELAPQVRGEIPSPLAPPSGCHFHPRCPAAMPRCSSERPAYREFQEGRWAACHLLDAGVSPGRSQVDVIPIQVAQAA